MRKTRPIELPQHSPQTLRRSLSIAHPLQDDTCDLRSDTLPLVLAMVTASETIAPVVRYETVAALSPHSTSTSDAANTSSLGDEFLNILLTQQQSPNDLRITSAPPLSPSLSYADEGGDNVSGSSSRAPRQMGRRAEARARVLSITASETSDGNQVNVLR